MILRHWGMVKGSARDDSGQAMVEAAMTLLLLWVFIFAIWEAGRVLQVQQTLTDAAREGARRSVAPFTQTTPGTMPTVADIQGFVQNYLQVASIHCSNCVAVTQVGPDSTNTTYTKVTVTYPYRVMTLSMFGSLNMTLTGQSLMRNETSQ